MLEELHNTFTRFLDDRTVQHFIRKEWHLAPAFFIEERLSLPRARGYRNPITESRPFPKCWIVYPSASGWDTLFNAVWIEDNIATLFCVEESTDTFFPAAHIDLDDPQVSDLRKVWRSNLADIFGPNLTEWAIEEAVPEIRECLQRIANGQRETVEPDALKRHNRKRSFKGKRKLAPFITIKPVVTAPRPHAGGTHASPIPHNRKAYERVMKKSGKIVQVRASKVRGGSITPRDYRVA